MIFMAWREFAWNFAEYIAFNVAILAQSAPSISDPTG